ncbi:MAG: hypothetical protein H7Y59_16835 [Anaerolineales bacterium]|nr:hypothetical protein [Anaerolineales bacterium]
MINKRLLIEAILGLILALILITVLSFQLHETRLRVEEITEQVNHARAGELAGISQLLDMNNGINMIQSGLLAVEAAKYGQDLQADQALRRYLDLAALPIAKVSHGDKLNTVYVAYSPDGQYVVSAGGNIIKVWEVQSGHIIASMSNYAVDSIAFSPDGKYLAAGGWDGTARVWEVNSGNGFISQSTNQYDVSMAFSPDSKFVAWSAENSIRVWNIKNKNEAFHIEYEGFVTHLMFSPNGRYILSSSKDRSARIWDAQSGQEVMELPHYSEVNKAIFSADGNYIVTASDDNYVRAWNVTGWGKIFEMHYRDNLHSVAISPDGRFVAVGGEDNTAQIWNVSYKTEVARMTHNNWVSSVAFSPDGKYVVSTSWEGPARIWVTTTGHEVARFADASIYSVAFSPDGKYIATGGCESLTYYQQGQPSICQGVARVWEISNGSQVFDISQSHLGGINSIAYNPINKNHVLTSNRDGTVRIWNIQDEDEIIHIDLGDEAGSTYAILSPDGKYILTRSTADNTARIWDSESGLQVSYMNYLDDVVAMDFSPNSQYVASGSFDGTIIVWEVKTGHQVRSITQVGSVRNLIFSPDGKYIASIDSGRNENIVLPMTEDIVQIWNFSNGQEIAHITYPSWVTTIAFSPDSQYIILAGTTDPLKKNFNGIISIRDILTGDEVANYMHPSHIYDLLFTSDGKHLISSSGDKYGTIVMWDMQIEKEVARILNGNPVSSLSLSPDGYYLVVGGRTTRIWDLQIDTQQIEVRNELTEDLSFIAHGRYLQSKNEIVNITYVDGWGTKFSPDGRYILTTGCDFKHYGYCNEDHIFILYWQIEDLIAETCRRLPRNFTYAEWVEYFPNEEYRATCPNLPMENPPTQ